jgi:hypothetical protein
VSVRRVVHDLVISLIPRVSEMNQIVQEILIAVNFLSIVTSYVLSPSEIYKEPALKYSNYNVLNFQFG